MRTYVAVAFVAATAATVALEVPDSLPAITFHTELVFVAERGLVLFYIALLAMLPLVRSVSRGEMPIEVSTRGARYQEEARESGTGVDEMITTLVEYARSEHDNLEFQREIDQRLDALEAAIRPAEVHPGGS